MTLLDRARESALGAVRRYAGDVAEQRLLQRTRRASTEELVQWAGGTGAYVSMRVESWQSGGAAHDLAEAQIGAASLVVVLEELEQRALG